VGAPVHQPTQAQSREPVVAAHTGRAPAHGSPAAVAANAGIPARDAYRLFSSSYDDEPNPMLSLEQRFVERLMPSVARRNVVDLGCGTGRWLAILAAYKPATLTGVDVSPEMLTQAGRKLGSHANLVLADCTSLLFPRASADIILCSFLTSYLPDLDAFAGQVRRLLRPGGTVFLTDLHPVTTAKLGWRRGFHADGSFVDVATYARPASEIVSAFARVGIEVNATLEPEFGEPERELMTRAGKEPSFEAAVGHPALLILQMSVKRARTQAAGKASDARTLRHLFGARVSLGANETVRTDVTVNAGRIQRLTRDTDSTPIDPRPVRNRRSVDLSGYLLLPGLINAHDHLEFALFPRLGKGGYRNFVEWADDIHRPGSSPVREHRAVARTTRLWWGGIRNLLAGVTTVCHHNPYVAEVFDSGFAIRVMRDFAWAHSLQMDNQLTAKHKGVRRDQPFILHLAEGVDPESASEIFRLARNGALDGRTVIVHGLGLDDRGLALLNSSGSALIWCPTSNAFLFGRTHDRTTLRSISKAALGSDSPLTAQGDLLDEIRFAQETVGISPEDLYSLVTWRASAVLRLQSGEGTTRIGALADFVGVRDPGLSPAQTLASLSYREVELVVIGGCVQLASPEIRRRMPKLITTGLRPLEVEGTIRWVRAPLRRLFAEAQRHLGSEIRLGGKRVRHGAPA
jgi:cytosine/adenosine deaminase-related metal-dependent hydrolase/SAM-dependent methyltransferase